MRITKKQIAENVIVTRISFGNFRYMYQTEQGWFDGNTLDGHIFEGGSGGKVGTAWNKKDFVNFLYEKLN